MPNIAKSTHQIHLLMPWQSQPHPSCLSQDHLKSDFQQTAKIKRAANVKITLIQVKLQEIFATVDSETCTKQIPLRHSLVSTLHRVSVLNSFQCSLYNNPCYSHILIGSCLWSIRKDARLMSSLQSFSHNHKFSKSIFQLLQFQGNVQAFWHRAALMTKSDLTFPAFSSRFLNFAVQFCFCCKFSFHEGQHLSQVWQWRNFPQPVTILCYVQ